LQGINNVTLKFGFQSRLLAAFMAAMLVVVLLAATTWKLVSDASAAAGGVEHTQAVLNLLAHIRSQTIQIELNTQGFRVSGDPARLDERNANIAAREVAMQALLAKIAGIPAQKERWVGLRDVLDERLRISRQVEHLRKTEGAAAATAFASTAPLQATRDRAHFLLTEMEALETSLLAERTQVQEASRERMLRSGVALSLLLLALFVVIYTVMQRQLRNLEASRRALADSEYNLSTTLYSIGDGVIATDVTGRITRMNKVAERLTGWPFALAKGRQINDVFCLFNEHTHQPVEVPVAQVLVTDAIHETASHNLLLRRDGTECPIANSAAAIRDHSGQVRGIVIVFRDESQAHQDRKTIAEQNSLLRQRVKEGINQLHESQKHLVNVINGVPALIAYVNADQRYVYVNMQYKARFAPDKSDITGMTVREVLGEQRYQTASPMIGRALQGMPQSYDWEPFPGVWQVINYIPKYDDMGGVSGYYVLGTDVTERKAHERELAHVANYDPLTELPNRRLLSDRLRQATLLAERSGKFCAICFLDLDGFKEINDQHGHDVGDQLLVGVSRNLATVLRAHDTLARLGGDEFVLLLCDLNNPNEAAYILDRVMQTVRQPVNVRGHAITVSASIGVTLYPHDNSDPDTLLRHADQTMYLAKQAGKARYQLFDPEIDRKTQDHREYLEHLKTALLLGEFVLFYQPKVDLLDGNVVGVEALVRWKHPARGLLSPGEFLPHLYGSDLELPFGEWVMNDALRQMAVWASAGLHIPVSINVSARHLLHAGFHDHLAQLLAHHPDIPASDLELEVLETAAIEDIELAQSVMRKCIGLGVQFSLDDFGTGYSSLTYLRKLPIQTLKIDQSFVRDMLSDTEDLSIVQGVIQLASAFHRKVIAEGVETQAHGIRLRDMGCRLAQGYGIARPMPADQVVPWRSQWLASGAWR
jgi:diguanylate cyclase (GGDEF)-like protein/PAS domain S-box-containing protein